MTESYCLRVQRSRRQQNCAPFEGAKKGSAPGLSPSYWQFLVCDSIVSAFTWCSFLMHYSESNSLLLVNTPVLLHQGPVLFECFLTSYICSDSVSNTRGQLFQYMNFKGTHSVFNNLLHDSSCLQRGYFFYYRNIIKKRLFHFLLFIGTSLPTDSQFLLLCTGSHSLALEVYSIRSYSLFHLYLFNFSILIESFSLVFLPVQCLHVMYMHSTSQFYQLLYFILGRSFDFASV